MTSSVLDLNILIASLGFATLVLILRTPSLYFGLSFLCLFQVGSASLSRYIHSTLFALSLDWLSDAHATVIRYSTIGCLAMLAGMALAWLPKYIQEGRPNKAAKSPVMSAPWINSKFAWFVLAMGVCAHFVSALTYDIATIGTAVHSLTSFATFGMLIHCAVFAREGKIMPLVYAMVIYVPCMLMVSFASGHSPAKTSLLIPAACIIGGFKRTSLRTVLIIAVSGFIFMTMMSGWMRSRGMIRSGHLQGKTFVEQLNEFLPEYLESSRRGALDPEAQHTTIHERLDLTTILAQQVRFQPTIEPYAYGQTFLDAGIALVPRIIWRDKPTIAGGSQFVAKFTGIRRMASDTTSVGLPYQFEFYANGGPYAVVIGLFVVGFLCAWLERGLFRKTNSLGGLLAWIACTMVVCDGGQRANVYIPCLVASGLTYFAVGYFVQYFFPDLTKKYFGIGGPVRAASAPVARDMARRRLNRNFPGPSIRPPGRGDRDPNTGRSRVL